jgi:hypothetical protein
MKISRKAMRPYIGLGILVTTIALCAAFTRAGPSLGGVLSCGLGLAPGALGYAETQAQQALEAQTNGYLRVCDANLDRYRIAFSPLTKAMANLAFQPVDLSSTQFTHFVSLGGASESVSGVPSRLYRGFLTPEGHTVTLFEHDLSADGSVTSRNPKDEPERIHGLPARLSVFQTPAGKAVSNLSWLEQRRWYELWIDANVVGTPLREQLFALAASLPLSVPACPNERMPEPIQMGANGFPIVKPMPKTMTQAEMEALLDETKRPCK